MKWRKVFGYTATAFLIIGQLGVGTPATPAVHAEDIIASPTPTPTATPANGDCSDFLCG